MFALSQQHLRRLCQINSFAVPDGDGLIFFGLRGLLPVNENDHEFRLLHQVQAAAVDHLHPRCLIGQWNTAKGTLAVFPASTTPCLKYLKTAKQKNGAGANELMTGFYKDYRKGIHKPGAMTGHEAFRQTSGRPIRRTADDFDFDTQDRVEFSNPYDNLHASWSMGLSHDGFASAGCQVIVGYPKCERRGKLSDAGPWKTFKENAYRVPQHSFPYVLLTGREAEQVAILGDQPLTSKLRFGSSGESVRKLQSLLKRAGFYEGQSDGDFGERTLRAVLAYQISTFGDDADDGIVGPMTAGALGLKLSKV